MRNGCYGVGGALINGSCAGLVTTIAGQVANVNVEDGIGTNAIFGVPKAVALDTTNQVVYVADSRKIRRVVLSSGSNF